MNAVSSIATLTIRRAGAADDAAIDAFVARHDRGTPFHRPAWLRGVEQGCGHRAHLLVAEARGAVTGYLPLSHVRSRLFGSALVSTGFAVGGGILATDPVAAERLAAAAVDLARELGCPTVELRGGEPPAGWRRCEGVYASFARPLPAGDEAILKAIPRKQRAEVRRAMTFGLEAEVHRDAALHHPVYAESVRNLGTPVFPRALFEAVLEAFGCDADILTVRKDGRAVASVLSLYHKGTVYPYWGGGTADARGLRANEALYFALMRHAAARGCTRFDFGRSKLGTGAFAFKKNWGFEPEPLTYAVHGALRDTNPLSAKHRLKVALWKKLPLPIANRIGPLVARGLG
ncbi:MAG TPA: FemAB family XrtA/PEP-CTERM system-associated protein [Allosphingosinicella sp.]|nr:FemAB family XrtA/PEP-CTERM system-associated protein [Allosphingosinicella sp.]